MASYNLNEVRCDAAAAAAVLMFIQSAASRYGGDARRWCRALWREIEKSDALRFHLPLTYLSPRRRAEGEAATSRRCHAASALMLLLFCSLLLPSRRPITTQEPGGREEGRGSGLSANMNLSGRRRRNTHSGSAARRAQRRLLTVTKFPARFLSVKWGF